MTNREWTELIAKEFNVSNSLAKSMLSAMMKVRKIKGNRSQNCLSCEHASVCSRYDPCINKAGNCRDYQ